MSICCFKGRVSVFKELSRYKKLNILSLKLRMQGKDHPDVQVSKKKFYLHPNSFKVNFVRVLVSAVLFENIFYDALM